MSHLSTRPERDERAELTPREPMMSHYAACAAPPPPPAAERRLRPPMRYATRCRRRASAITLMSAIDEADMRPQR